jgi:hypothetical protein
MNIYTRMIMELLKVDAETAIKVQYFMECMNIDFSESSTRAFNKAAREAYASLDRV